MNEMEEAVKEQLSGKPKKKKKKKKANSKKASEASDGGAIVDIGDLDNLGLGNVGGSDDEASMDLINFD